MMNESLYFIAIVPPKNVQETITSFKLEIAEKYDSKHALRSPPHITLHMPFRLKDRKLDSLLKVVEKLNEQLVSFNVQLKDFNFFEPRVVYVGVAENEQLTELQKKVVSVCRKELLLDNANYKNQPFQPHVTIGFRDLKKQMFYQAKEEFSRRKTNFEFTVDKICLLKHDGTKWSVIK